MASALGVIVADTFFIANDNSMQICFIFEAISHFVFQYLSFAAKFAINVDFKRFKIAACVMPNDFVSYSCTTKQIILTDIDSSRIAFSNGVDIIALINGI